MIVKSLELKNFRNYRELKVCFDAGTNILYGDNAQGKTNVLESLCLCGTTRSHKGSKDREMIRFGEKEAHIRAVVEKNGIPHQIDFHLKQDAPKGIAVDRIPIRRAAELFGMLNLVFFSPEDLTIIKEGPSRRRHFLDLEMSQLDPVYLNNLTKYNKILRQRNQLLKDLNFRPELEDTLSVWDEQLITCGVKIIEQRKKFIEELGETIRPIHSRISGEKEQLQLFYEPDCDADCFAEKLLRERPRDRRTGVTGVGPQRDDICFSVNGTDIRRFGSQGQQRTGALSLKLAEIALIREKTSETPVLLLDDVLSELDSKRQNYLLNNIQDVQAIITCTGLDEFVKNRFQINRVFFVKDGKIEEQGEF